jgi:hypothetical protein
MKNNYSDFENPITELERVNIQLKHLADEEE